MRSFSHYHLPKLILVAAACAAVGGALLGAVGLATGRRLFASEGAFVGYFGIGLIILVADRLVARLDGWLSRRSALPATAVPSVAPGEDDR